MRITNRRTGVLVLLALIFMLPGPLAYWVYKHPQWVQGVGTNRGVLLTPPTVFAKLSTNTPWRLVLWVPDRCDEACVSTLNQLARVRLALGRHLYAVSLYLTRPANASALPASLKATLHQMDIQCAVLSAEDRARQKSLNLMNTRHILILNQANQGVLLFRADATPQAVFHDLNKLIVNSPGI